VIDPMTQAAGEYDYSGPRAVISKFNVLDRVEWSFSNRARYSDLEAIHPYPAKFIPDLPGALLDHLPIEPGNIVLDPFVGSGTTLVECQKRGIPSIGIDLNPIAASSRV
jgi:DNA modification methylase